MAPPTDEPLSKSAVANPRSLFGNHSETALVAAGQFADSPAPSRNRKKAKLCRPRGQRSEHRNQRIESDRVGNSASRAYAVNQPPTNCLSQGVRNAKSNHDRGIIRVRPVKVDLQKWRQNRKRLPVEIIDDRGGKK